MCTVTEIPEIPFSSLMHYLQVQTKKTWSIVKFKNPLPEDHMDFLNKIEELSKTKIFQAKDGGIYNECYEGVSLQKNIFPEEVISPDYDSLNEIIGGGFIDNKTKEILYSTRTGITRDKGYFNKPQDQIEYIDLNQRPDLYEIYLDRLKRPWSTTYMVLNDWALMFKPLLDFFIKNNIVLYRGRLLLNHPGMTSEYHVDLDVRLHIPVFTDENCRTEFRDDNNKFIGNYFMPADGYFYLFNGHLLHKFYNNGSKSRLHVIFGLTHGLVPRWSGKYKDFDQIKKDFIKENNI